MARLSYRQWNGAWRATSLAWPLARHAFVAHGTSCLLLPLLLLVTVLACPASHWSRAHRTSCLTAIPWHGHGVPLVFDGMRHDTPLCPAMARGMACLHNAEARSTICLCATGNVMPYGHAMAQEWRATCIQWLVP